MVIRNDRFIDLWSDGGVHTVPPGSLVTSGWVPGHEPEAEYENWVKWSRDKSQNFIMAELNRKDLTPPLMDLSDQIGGIYNGHDFSVAYGQHNGILPNYAWINCCRGYSHDWQRESAFFIIYDDSTVIYEFIVDDDLKLVNNGHSITLPVNHIPDAICSDGDAIYVLCLTDGVGGGAVSKFSINPWGSTPVWTRTLPYNINSSGLGNNKIIIANDNNVALLYRDTFDVAPPLGLLAKDNSLLTNGYGNMSPSSTYICAPSLCSDGVYLHFVVEFSSGDIMGSAAITDITLSPYANWSMAGSCGECATDGISVLAVDRVSRNMHIMYSSSVKELNAYHFEDAELLNDSYPRVVFDGMKFWFLWEFSGLAYNNAYIIPFDINRWTADENVLSISEPKTMISRPQPSSDPTGDARMCFADNALWIIPKVNDLATVARRIPHLSRRY